MTDRGPLYGQDDTPDDVASLYSWANLHGAKYRDFSASRAQTREMARQRVQQALEAEQARMQLAAGQQPEGDQAAQQRRMVEEERVEQAQREAELAAQQQAAQFAAQESARQAAEQAARQAAEQEAARRAAEWAAVRVSDQRAAQEAAERAAAQQAAAAAQRAAEELAVQEAQAAQAAQWWAAEEAARRAAEEAAERARLQAAQEAAQAAALQAAQEAAQKVAREAAEQAARQAAEQEAAQRAAQEAARHAAQQSALTATRQAAERAAQEIARLAARQAAQLAAQQAAEQAETAQRDLAAAQRAEASKREQTARELAAQIAAQKAAQEAAECAAQQAARQAEQEAAQQAEWQQPLYERYGATIPAEPAVPKTPARTPEFSPHFEFPGHAAPAQPRTAAPETPYSADAPYQPQVPYQPQGPYAAQAQQAPMREDGYPPQAPPTTPLTAPWPTAERRERPGEVPGRPAWLTPERPEAAPAQAMPSAPEDTLQGSRERLASRWYALRSLFDGPMPAEAVPTPAPARAPVTAVFSLAGGVGKTSLVATLGRALSARGERVLLVDTAPYGLLPFFFGARDQRPGLLRTFSPPGVSSDAPIQMITLDPEGLGPDATGQDALATEISTYARGVNRVIVDLATASGATTRRVMRMAPMVVVPMVPDMNSVVSVSSIDSFFQHNGNPATKPSLPHYVLNQFDPSLPLHLDIREVLREQLGDRLLPFAIRRAPAVSEALAEGMTVMDYAPNSTVAEDFGSLAGWVKSQSAPASTTYRGVRWSER